jgi:lactate dehydrogenase-like 2-hydroxyacid dehydrogenase
MATDRPAILLTTRLPGQTLKILSDAGDVIVASRTLDHAALCEAAPGQHAILAVVSDRIDAAVLDAAGPSLRIVANVAVGFDNIDVVACRARGVTVTNTPGVLTNGVAEFTLALILAVTRRLGEGERLVRSGEWKGWSMDCMVGMELTGKQLGIVGAGRIGRGVASKAAALGMSVVFAKRGDAADVDGHPMVPFDDLLATSDVLSLHVPLRPDTRHLIDARAIARMKPSAYLINTTRGAVIDEAALAKALRDRVIAGAALDVFEREPIVHPDLFDLDNVVLQPHIGSATIETRSAMGELAARNVVAVLAGKPPITPV